MATNAEYNIAKVNDNHDHDTDENDDDADMLTATTMPKEFMVFKTTKIMKT